MTEKTEHLAYIIALTRRLGSDLEKEGRPEVAMAIRSTADLIERLGQENIRMAAELNAWYALNAEMNENMNRIEQKMEKLQRVAAFFGQFSDRGNGS